MELVDLLIFVCGASVGIVTAIVAIWYQSKDSSLYRSENKRQRDIDNALFSLKLMKEDSVEFFRRESRRLRTIPSLHTNWMMWCATWIHLWWGLTFLIIPPLADGPDFHGGAAWNTFYELPLSYQQWGLLMLAAAVASIGATFIKNWKAQLALLLPQQFVLMVGAFGAFAHVFLDWGYDYALTRELRIFPIMVFPALFHSIAMIDHFLPNIFRKVRTDYPK